MSKTTSDLITTLEGKTYTPQQHPPVWYNETPLLWNEAGMESLPLYTFPIFHDFSILLEQLEVCSDSNKERVKYPFGYHVSFMSAASGYIANFPWWDHVELEICQQDFAIPLGTLAQPFSDLEQGWTIDIATDGHCVYIIQGDFDLSHSYRTWFRVPEELYFSQWQKVIQQCRQIKKSKA